MPLNLFDYDHPKRALAVHGDTILRGLDDGEWRTLLEFVERQMFPSGVRILQQGDVDRTLYILESGHVDVVIEMSERSEVVATIGPGSVFGELAFFDGAPRSASIISRDACALLRLPHSAFNNLAAWHPRIARELLFDLGRVLSARLRRIQTRS